MDTKTQTRTDQDIDQLFQVVHDELSHLQDQIKQLRKENQLLNNRVQTLTKAVHHQSQGMY